MLKAAVVGVGYLGTFHAEKFAASERSELVAVVDVNEERAKRVAERLGTQSLTDYRELVQLGVNCVSIAADTARHCEIATWFLEHGVDVLVEKPMAATLEEGRQLVETAKRCGRILQVGHLERFNPAFRAMQRILTRPHFFEARRISPFAGRGTDVDVVLDLMIHDIDIIAHLVGRPLESVDAIGVPVITENVDIANARLRFEGGAIANVTASRVSFKSERSMRIFQPDVYITLDYGNKKLKCFTKTPASEPGQLPQIGHEEYSIEERDALYDQISSFLEVVESRGEPVVSGEDGLRALELAARIRRAFRESLDRFDSPPAIVIPGVTDAATAEAQTAL